MRDFSQETHQRAAMKNAYILISRREFLRAASFLLLANKRQDAINLLIKSHHDPQLAMFVSILLEGDDSPTYRTILSDHIKTIAQFKQDAFLQAVVAWNMNEYQSALDAILQSFDPAYSTSAPPRIDRYFLDNHSHCDCLQFPVTTITTLSTSANGDKNHHHLSNSLLDHSSSSTTPLPSPITTSPITFSPLPSPLTPTTPLQPTTPMSSAVSPTLGKRVNTPQQTDASPVSTSSISLSPHSPTPLSSTDWSIILPLFMRDEALPLVVAILYTPYHRFEINTYVEWIWLFAQSEVNELGRYGFVDVLFVALHYSLRGVIEKIGLREEEMVDRMKGILEQICLKWMDHELFLRTLSSSSSSTSPINLIKENDNNPISDPFISCVDWMMNRSSPYLSYSSFCATLRQQIKSGYCHNLIIPLASIHSQDLPSFLHLLFNSLAHINSTTLRTVQMTPFYCGRKARFASSLLIAWFDFLIAVKERRLPEPLSTGLEESELMKITRQAILGVFEIGWETSDDHLLYCVLQYASRYLYPPSRSESGLPENIIACESHDLKSPPQPTLHQAKEIQNHNHYLQQEHSEQSILQSILHSLQSARLTMWNKPLSYRRSSSQKVTVAEWSRQYSRRLMYLDVLSQFIHFYGRCEEKSAMDGSVAGGFGNFDILYIETGRNETNNLSKPNQGDHWNAMTPTPLTDAPREEEIVIKSQLARLQCWKQAVTEVLCFTAPSLQGHSWKSVMDFLYPSTLPERPCFSGEWGKTLWNQCQTHLTLSSVISSYYYDLCCDDNDNDHYFDQLLSTHNHVLQSHSKQLRTLREMKNSIMKSKQNKRSLYQINQSSLPSATTFTSLSSAMNNQHHHSHHPLMDRGDNTCIRFTYRQHSNASIPDKVDCVVPFDSLPSLLVATREKKEKTVHVGLHSLLDNTTEVGIFWIVRQFNSFLFILSFHSLISFFHFIYSSQIVLPSNQHIFPIFDFPLTYRSYGYQSTAYTYHGYYTIERTSPIRSREDGKSLYRSFTYFPTSIKGCAMWIYY